MAAIRLSDEAAGGATLMELYQLRTFLAIARTGNLTRAAANLATSQPAVSAQLKALEEELGVALFSRNARGMELTPAGAVLCAKAEEVQARAAELLALAGTLSGKVIGTARIGLNTDAGVLRIPELVDAVAARAPHIDLQLVHGTSAGVVRDVAAGLLTAGFVFGGHGNPALDALALAWIELVIAAPATWAERLAAAQDQALAGPWVWPPRECPYHGAAIALARGNGAEAPGGVTADDEATMLRLVEAGSGIALVPAPLAREAEAGGQVAVVRSTGAEVTLSFVWRARDGGLPIVRPLVEALRAIWKPEL
jgi:DNA-binding transcriptional LysR family regulator